VHALTRTQDLLCRSQALCHHASPFGDTWVRICLLIKESVDDVVNLVYNDLDNNIEILCGDGGVNIVI
jgi:hypothetical protein